MGYYWKTETASAVGTGALEVVLGPVDLRDQPIKSLSLTNTGTDALADCVIETGATDGTDPSTTEIWVPEDISLTAIPTLGASATDGYTFTNARRWLRVRAQGGGADSDLVIHLEARG